ncbi:hypothetical protein SGRA_2575 [Saprospira grandis str. Lewin]|uniref:Uncharacterized protein n=1 Tax=Saprospira grandis (strain Lewin) TaxID=984262 RepID=H6L6Q7_SAPGL|nr:hypothetical protein SGRA_2575 [Saprospira grandis str. Lewin]
MALEANGLKTVANLRFCRAEGPQAEGWTAVAAGQTELAQPAKGRANSELRHSPTRPQGGAAPKK